MVDAGEAFFGVKHQDLALVHEPDIPSRWLPKERRFGEFDPCTTLTGVGQFQHFTALANFYLERLQPTSAEPILMNGDDVIASANKIGTGHVYLIGTFLGFSALAYQEVDAGTDAFLAHLLQIAKVRPERYGNLLRRRRTLNNKEAWFFINPTALDCTELIDKEGYSIVVDLLDDNLIAETDETMTIRIPSTNIGCLIMDSD